MKVPAGWTVGACFGAYCTARMAWPPNTVGADIQCDSQYPHKGHVHPTRYPKPANRNLNGDTP